jgi:hypothetical protein
MDRPVTATWDGYHIGRSWNGHYLEDACPCQQAPCGLVAVVSPGCSQHAPEATKTIRQRHLAEDCPGTSP